MATKTSEHTRRASAALRIGTAAALWLLPLAVGRAGEKPMTGPRTTKTSGSPHCRLRGADPGCVRWTKGFWAQRFELCGKAMIPTVLRALQNPRNAAVLSNFRVAAGLAKGKHLGTDWGDGDCYKFLEAAAWVYSVTGDPKLDRLMDRWIEVIAKAQDPDGYISTNIQLTAKKRWRKRHHHELYNMGHLLTAACVHYRMTGKDSFLNVARKLGDCLYKTFQPRPAKLAHYGWNPSNIMGLADLYRATGDRRYLELAGIFVDMRGSAPGGSDQNQYRVPLRKETEAVGHAVTATYLWCGAADVYAETGEKALLDALQRLWRNVTDRKMYLTGGIAALHRGKSSRGDSVHEALGLDYELPSRTAYNETCANIGNAMWNWRMLAITGQAKYADVMERVLYNSMLSAVGVDGRGFFYTNPLRREGPKTKLLSNDTPQRWSVFTCYCCPVQVLRTIGKLHGWVYSLSADGVWINLYGPSKLDTRLPDGSPIKLTQATKYPWDGRVKITVNQATPKKVAVMLRIPAWADGAEIKLNGKAALAAVKPGTYARVERKWGAGDTIELTLPMEVRLLRAHAKVADLRDQVAVMRGPIVYCLESADLPKGVGIDEVRIPLDIRLTARHDTALLGGVTVLEGQALRVRRDDWKGRLYRPLRDAAKVPIRLIPYYAWANRGITQMTVWLPLP